MFEIFKEFRFEAAHSLPGAEWGGKYSRLHGHSFRAQVFLLGERTDAGWVHDLGDVAIRLTAVREELDHRFLNDIEELGPPTLENLAHFIWRRLEPSVPALHKVIVYRDSCGEGCIYHGPSRAKACQEAKEVAYA